MSYTALAFIAVVLAIIIEKAIGAKLFKSPNFFLAYFIVMFFQLVTNGYLTGQEIVTYGEDMIMGARVANAPVEDLLFGFALVTLSMSVWSKLTERDERRAGNKETSQNA